MIVRVENVRNEGGWQRVVDGTSEHRGGERERSMRGSWSEEGMYRVMQVTDGRRGFELE